MFAKRIVRMAAGLALVATVMVAVSAQAAASTSAPRSGAPVAALPAKAVQSVESGTRASGVCYEDYSCMFDLPNADWNDAVWVPQRGGDHNLRGDWWQNRISSVVNAGHGNIWFWDDVAYKWWGPLAPGYWINMADIGWDNQADEVFICENPNVSYPPGHICA